MPVDYQQWRTAIGSAYNNYHGVRYVCISGGTCCSSLLSLSLLLCFLMHAFVLLVIAGDIELNPGPMNSPTDLPNPKRACNDHPAKRRFLHDYHSDSTLIIHRTFEQLCTMYGVECSTLCAWLKELHVSVQDRFMSDCKVHELLDGFI